MSRSLAKTTILRERQRRADCAPIFAHYNYEGFHFSNLRPCGTFRKLISRIATSDESHFGLKRQFCASANGGRISLRLTPATLTRDFDFPILRLYGFFWKQIYRFATSDESHFGQNDNSARVPTLGGFQPYFPPLKLRGAHFPNFTDSRSFWEIIHRIVISDESQFGQKLRCIVKANGGRISVRFPPATTTMDFDFPILRLY